MAIFEKGEINNMSSQVNRGEALSILSTVNTSIQSYLGNTLVIPFAVGHSYDAQRDSFCKETIKSCELAEQKAPNDPQVLYLSNLYKAQLYGCWEKVQGVRGTYKNAVDCYEYALRLASGRPAEEAQTYYRYGIFCSVAGKSLGGGKEKAIWNLERVIQLVGPDSDLGKAAAQELNNVKTSSSGMCFIATAVYGSPLASEVIVLNRFRDDVLLKSKLGTAFTKTYYLVSPPFASMISKTIFLRRLMRKFVLSPILMVVKRHFDSKGKRRI